MSSNVVDYSQYGPVTEVNVMCDTCPTTIEIYFEQPATFLVLGAEAECCSKSWFCPSNYDCISSERVRAELNKLVGHRISTVVYKKPHKLLKLASSARHTVSLDVFMTFHFGNASLILWLLNESDNGHSGSISERLHVLPQ
jgi:hypothetical protein